MTRMAFSLSRIARLFDIVTLNFCAFLAIVMSLTLLSELVARNLMGTTIIWSAELATMCFVWIAFLGSTAAARRRSHFSVDLLDRWIIPGGKGDYALDLLAAAVFVAFGAVLLLYGIDFVQNGMRRFSFSLGIAQGYAMVVMPLSGALFAFYGLCELLSLITGARETDAERT